MAYPICPDCRMPQAVGDDMTQWQCFTCYCEVRFFTCPHCTKPQSVAKRWAPAFTCGNCNQKVDVPYNIPYPEQVKAFGISDVGYPYPKL